MPSSLTLLPTLELHRTAQLVQHSDMAPAHPSVGEHLVVSFPAPKTLCLRINRPKALGAMNDAMEADLCKMLDWAEEAPGIWVIVITGTGRAFCAGADLKAWDSTQGSEASPTAKMTSNPHGFGSIARRRSKKVYVLSAAGRKESRAR